MKKIKKEELELLSYQDIAKLILEDKKKGETTLTIFTEVCRQIGLTNEELQDKIGDFYTALTIDKRFTILKDGKWDLKANHTASIKTESDDDDDDSIGIEDNIDDENDDEDNDDDLESDDDFDEDGLEGLVIVEEEEDLN